MKTEIFSQGWREILFNCETLTSQWFVPRGLQLQTEAFSTPSFIGDYVKDVKKKRKEKGRRKERKNETAQLDRPAKTFRT